MFNCNTMPGVTLLQTPSIHDQSTKVAESWELLLTHGYSRMAKTDWKDQRFFSELLDTNT